MSKYAASLGVAILVLAQPALSAADLTLQFNDFDSGGSTVPALGIPDGSPAGISDTRLVSGTGIAAIGSLRVGLEISGGFIGDLYAYLRYENGSDAAFSVLLNRLGRSAANPLGGPNAGLNLSLRDDATDNAHDYLSVGPVPPPGDPVAGEWQPDGRNIDPGSSGAIFDATSPSTPLSGFNGFGADGEWTLFVADMSSGVAHQVESWSLTIVPVPEPAHAGVVLMVLGGWWAIRRARRRE
ncbi:MAG: PEP-CTERM sorting domain-containing protein [Verrucomicrobiales bacterium]|nr:PEP-CTERM sorting domain-containing protein [Verrucomicrobiales bacterium]